MKLVPALITVLILLCQAVGPADAAQLMYIRVGEYESMTRLVFEFDGRVKFKGPQIRGPGRVEVDFIETMPVSPVLQKMRDRSKHIEKIEFAQNKSFLRANIGLASSSFNLKSFYLFAPDRLVLDIYWTDAPVASMTAKTPLPEKAPEAVPTLAVPEKVPQAPSEPTTVEPLKTLNPGKEIERQALQPTVTSSQWQRSTLVKLIGLFLVAIIMALFVYFVFLKKRHFFLSKNRVTPERAEPGVDDRLDQDNIRALDSKIRDELDKYGK